MNGDGTTAPTKRTPWTRWWSSSALLNSAGDPFDSVPKVMVPAPVFTKVMKFKARQSGWASAHCKVNGAPVEIGGVEFPTGSLLCTVAEKRIIGSKDWKYQYTVRLRYKSNLVVIEQTDPAVSLTMRIS